MNIKEFFDKDLRAVIVSGIFGVIAGYISFTANESLFSFVTAIVLLIISQGVIKAIWKIKEERKWWFSNGIIMFVFTWFVIWTIFYNIAVV